MLDKFNSSILYNLSNIIGGILLVIFISLLYTLLCTDFFKGENALLILPVGIVFLILLFVAVIIHILSSLSSASSKGKNNNNQ